MSTPNENVQPGLSLARADERRPCAVAASLVPSPDSREQVAFADASELRVTIVDYSNGGLGVHGPRFVPQGCLVRVVVPGNGSRGPEESQGRVQRVAMIDRGPSYYLGLSFPDTAGSGARVVGAIRMASEVQGE